MAQQSPTQLSTGIQGLDQVIRAVLPGDNIVWHVDNVESYAEFVKPYVRHALASGRGLVYFRFAAHEPLV